VKISRSTSSTLALLSSLLLLSACSKHPDPPQTQTPTSTPNPRPDLWKKFSGPRAFEDVQRQINLGPRPSGSPEIEAARLLIEKSLIQSGWFVERQPFTNQTPRGPIPFVNLIARFPASPYLPASPTAQRAILCTHYDTKRFSTIRFVGASDAASSTGALLELARTLALHPPLATQIELVFFDGEEAFTQFTPLGDPHPDGLFGSRFYASQLQSSGRSSQFRFAILWDMIGDRLLSLTLSSDSPPDLKREILASAHALNLDDAFIPYSGQIFDDHVPLQVIARIPSIDLIDFDYPPWHTADDTLDKLSPESLEKVAAITLHYLQKSLPPK